MKTFFFSLALIISSHCGIHADTFALDPLSGSEQSEAAQAVIKDFSAHYPNDSTRFLLDRVELLEPAKGALSARKALVTIWNGQADTYYSYVYTFADKKIASSEKIPHARPSFTRTEEAQFATLALNDPDFLKAIERRKISKEKINFTVYLDGRLQNRCCSVYDEEASSCDSCCSEDEEGSCCQVCRSCSHPTPEISGRSYYGVPFVTDRSSPIDQITVFANLSHNKVKVIDNAKTDQELLPVHDAPINFERGKRGTLKDLVTYQQNHNLDHSYTRNGYTVSWENWKFQYAMHPRTGLVLYNVTHLDRSVLYRASTNSASTLYGDNVMPFKNHLLMTLEGDYPYKAIYSRLRPGVDVPPYAEMISCDFIDENGKLYSAQDALGLYEQDGGLLWRRYDAATDTVNGRRARQLVLTCSTSCQSHDFAYYWIFNQDGSIDVEVKITGEPLVKQSNKLEHYDLDPQFAHGNLVERLGIGVNRYHTFSFRLDFDIDGQLNQVVEHNMVLDDENPCGTNWHLEKTLLTNSHFAQREINPQSYRSWVIENPNREAKGDLGHSPSYALIPHTNGLPLFTHCSRIYHKAPYSRANLIVTKYDDNELDLLGKYPSEASKHPISKNDALSNQDIVVWYTMNGASSPSPEECPLMPVDTYRFSLKPRGFFTENPALDVDKGRFVTRP